MRTVLLVIVALVMLGAAGAYATHIWLSLEGVEVPFWVNVAAGAGIAVALGMWIGLVRLSYISSKRGYDDAAGRSPGGAADPDPDRD